VHASIGIYDPLVIDRHCRPIFLLFETASDIWLYDPCIEIAGVGGADSSKLKCLENFLQALFCFFLDLSSDILLTESDELSHISQNQGQNRAFNPVLRFSSSLLGYQFMQ
jgi:hypothetical protein